MHKRISRAIIHFSWFLLVSTIVITTLLVSLIWLTSSSIDDLRPNILEWVHTTTGQPIEVDNLAIEWRGIIPHLKLSDIEVLDRNTHESLTHLDQASLSVDLYHSLVNWNATIGHLELSGLNVELVHKKDGTISLLGLTEQASSGDEFTQWLLEQPHLKISDSQIVWHEQERQIKPIKLSDVDLELTNQSLANTHQLSGSTSLANNAGSIEFQLNVTGDPLSQDWDADLDLTTEEFKFSNYLPADINEKIQASLQINTISIDHSSLNSTTHINWKKAEISDVDGEFFLKSTTPIYSISGKFTAEETPAKNWLLTAPDLTIAAEDHQWQPFSLGLLIPENFSQDNPSIDVAINNLNVEDLITLVPESIKKSVINFQPRGELNDLRIQYDQKNSQRPLIFDGEFSDLETLAYEKIPGFKNLSGKFQSNMEALLIDFNSHNLIVNNLSESGELDPPIKLDSLIGEINWRRLDQGWVVSTPQLTISNPDIEFQLTGILKNDTINSPHLEVQGTFFRGNIEPVVKHIPSNLIHHKVKEWLDSALIGGRVTGGNLSFQGALDKFPFDKNSQQEIFEIRLNAEDGIVDYFEGWPLVEEITAEVIFNSHEIIVTSPSAKINGADVSNVTVKIPELVTQKHHLVITGNAKGDMKQGLQYINNSPLKSSVGKQLDHLKISGNLNLDLDIDIPLSNPDRTKIQGKVHLRKNTLLLESLDINIKSLAGDFIFDQDRWQAKDLKARLYESAININLDINKSKNKPKSDVRITGLADKNYITNRMIQLGMKRENLKVLDSISGTTHWMAQLSLPPGIGDPDGETGLVITSMLKGLNVRAPAPQGKLSSEERALKISTTLSKKLDRQVSFEYGNIKGEIKLEAENEKTSLKNIVFHFGNGQLSNTKNNKHLITANGNIKNLDLSAWIAFFDKHFGRNNKQSEPDENFLKFDLTIGHLKAFGQSFKKSHVLGRSSKNTWELQVEDHDNSGMISIPYQLSGQAVKADFERLRIVSSDHEEDSEFIQPKKIPEVMLTSQQFKYNDLQLGSLQLHTKPKENGLSVEKLVLSVPAVNIDVKGDWTGYKTQQSKFNILANGQALSPMLGQFGFDSSGIEGGETSIVIDAAWQGSPADFELAKLKGSLSLDVGNGRFTEIKNRVGKVFGLLSIQSLGRRLSLDFNDLFKEGFTFDKISATFDIESGNAYTNNLNIFGTSAKIDITGRVGLSDQDYDQLITVTPSVADSLPVASVLFGPIGAGVGAAIYIAEKVLPVLPEAIDKVLERQYTLKGRWEEPVVEPLVVAKKEQSGKVFQ